MTDSAVRSIGSLVGRFVVEDYQRGYKWKAEDVSLLLRDVEDFQGNGFYCLQPIVIRDIPYDNGRATELIDGQQRLTTIFIILSVLTNGDLPFELIYRTRPASQDFLRDIRSLAIEESWNGYLGKPGNEILDNIDNYHFFNAYVAASKWCKKHSPAELKDFYNKMLLHVKVIWYELPAANTLEYKPESNRIFSRINGGKIELTNAELIKALFLINAGGSQFSEKLRLKQNEIAAEWDQMEYALQDDNFWYFLSNEPPPATRIELLFDLIAQKRKGDNEKLRTFLNYNDSFRLESDKSKWVLLKWEEVKTLFATLKEWYEDRILFHMIGFLIWKKIALETIVGWTKEREFTKPEFLRKVRNESHVKLGKRTLEKIAYGSRSLVEEILVLHNILTLLQNEESADFSFAKYKNGSWDIEHIHARESKDIKKEKDWKEWIVFTRKAMEKLSPVKETEGHWTRILTSLRSAEKNGVDKEGFDSLFYEILEFYEMQDTERTEMNELSNLALLDSGTNRSYQNAIFSVKRDKIIDQDKKGVFIPICTKNVFLKYYTDDPSRMFLWTSEDRKAYFDDIKKIVTPYLIFA